jgi:hypothetical protein
MLRFETGQGEGSEKVRQKSKTTQDETPRKHLFEHTLGTWYK